MKPTPAAPANIWTVPCAQVADVLSQESAQIVDLRSPSEFEDDHLPGAYNLPLFGDLERTLVGTLYKRVSPDSAFDEGRKLVRERIAPLVLELAELTGRPMPVEQLDACVERLTEGGLQAVHAALGSQSVELPAHDSLVLHCWRGGLRSSSLVVLLRELGWRDVFVLEGGYKSYRRKVLADLKAFQFPQALVLRGSTGVGKTLVLREIERIRPGLTLDLEGLAGHRSSVLGMVGLEPCSQKVFESRLALRLRAGFPGAFVVEGESRKVGDAVLPASVWAALQAGTNYFMEAPIDYRVRVLIEDYLEDEANRTELRKQLPFIEQRLGPRKWDGELVRRLDDGREEELVEILLELYYDPLYLTSEKGHDYACRLDATDVEGVARQIVALVDKDRGQTE